MHVPVQQTCVYVCKENDTARSIAKKMCLSLDELLEHNRSVWPELMPSSRFKKDTHLRLTANGPQASPPLGVTTKTLGVRGADCSEQRERRLKIKREQERERRRRKILERAKGKTSAAGQPTQRRGGHSPLPQSATEKNKEEERGKEKEKATRKDKEDGNGAGLNKEEAKKEKKKDKGQDKGKQGKEKKPTDEGAKEVGKSGGGHGDGGFGQLKNIGARCEVHTARNWWKPLSAQGSSAGGS